MLSTSLFAQNGTRYPQKVVFGPTFTLNQTALNEVGLPALTGMHFPNLPVQSGSELVFLLSRFERMEQLDAKPRHRRAYHTHCVVLGTLCHRLVQAS